jgi:hypothetical protein
MRSLTAHWPRDVTQRLNKSTRLETHIVPGRAYLLLYPQHHGLQHDRIIDTDQSRHPINVTTINDVLRDVITRAIHSGA